MAAITPQPALPSVGDVDHLTAATTRLDLAGSFTHPHWLAFLCGGLSAAGVSVVSGTATRLAPMQWDGHLLVSGPADGLDTSLLAATRPAVRDAGVLRLSSYAVRRLAGGELELAVEAPDKLGFLGRLLSRVSLLTLLPSALDIATVGGLVTDRLVLGGIGTSQPDEDVRAALEDLLARAVT